MWEPQALRKIHEAPEIHGQFEILLEPVPVLPAVYTPAQLILVAAANIPPPNYPDPPQAAAVALDVSRYSALLAFYKIALERYNRQQNAKNNLKEGMWESLDQTTRDIILPVRADYNPLTFQALFALIKAHFQHITPAHLLSIEADIKSPLVFNHPNAFDDQVAKITSLNRALESAGRTRSQIDQTSDLRHSLMTSPYADIFAPFLGIYDVNCPTIPTQSFVQMHETCSAAIPQLLAILTSTTLSQYGANGVQNTRPPPAPARGNPRPTRRPLTTGGTPAYCWTHGMTFHSSTGCRNKAVGHQDKATATNKMGGKN